MSFKLTYHYASERPSVQLWALSPAQTLMDLSTYTATLKVGGTFAAPTLTLTCTTAVGAGTNPTGTPNVTGAWTAGQITAALGTSRGIYPCWLTLTTGGLDDVRVGTFEVLE